MTLAALYVALALIAGSLTVLVICLRVCDNRADKHRWVESGWTGSRGFGEGQVYFDLVKCRKCGAYAEAGQEAIYGCPGRKGRKQGHGLPYLRGGDHYDY